MARLEKLSEYRQVLVPVAMLAMLAVIVVPMPPVLMDLMLSANLALAVLILLTTLFVNRPLDFSVFPSLLLATTLFRLTLNVASTRLILSADVDTPTPENASKIAGGVIETFAGVVTSGSLIVGLIIFLILIIVQFVVITKGATRISEVAARFTLDGMPGKQMAIDADLNAGLIDEKEARNRRDEIVQEADFYGSMDGAAKFVRGDAVAGIIITVVNIIGGISVGMLIKGWGFAETLELFTRLTIGDGLVSQMPALIISIAAGLIVTRSSGRSNLGSELATQLTHNRAALVITAVFMLALAVLGLPVLPMLVLAAAVGGIAYLLHRGQKQQVAAAATQQAEADAKPPEPPPIEQAMRVDALGLEVGYGLVKMVDKNAGAGDLLERIDGIRRQLAAELGLVMPPVRIKDNMQLQPNEYRVHVRGNAVAAGQVFPEQFMAMDGGLVDPGGGHEALRGVKTREPAFGLDAVWIDAGQKQRAESLGYTVVDAGSVLATHLTEVVKNHAHELLSREETNNLITALKDKAPKLVDEVLTPPGDAQPLVRPGELQKVLQNLLRERVPIRDLETVVETLGDWATRTKDFEVLTEYVRNALRRTICHQYAVQEPAGDGLDAGLGSGGSGEVTRLYCVSLDPGLEDQINGYIERSAEGATMTMPPQVANRITAAVLGELNRLVQAGHHPVVLASPQVRAAVRRLVEPHLPTAAVLGYNEVSKGVEVESLGLVQMSDEGGRVSRPAAPGSADVGSNGHGAGGTTSGNGSAAAARDRGAVMEGALG